MPADVLRERLSAWFPFGRNLIEGLYHTERGRIPDRVLVLHELPPDALAGIAGAGARRYLRQMDQISGAYRSAGAWQARSPPFPAPAASR